MSSYINFRKGSGCIKTIKFRLIIVLGIVFFLIMSTSGIYALNSQTQGKTNPVDIELETYKDVSNGVEEEDTQYVSPGQVISLTPRVENLGIDCYLRVKFSYINSNTNFLDYVTGFSSRLVKHGEYYYVEPVFPAGSILDFFNTIKIPEDAETRAPDGNFTLEIIAEAIQADGFEPDYSLEDPWKGVVPEENDGKIYDLDDDTEEDTVNPRTGDSIDIFVITFVISAIGLIITMILYAIERKK